MATIISAATGNFTATTTWVGGVVPGPADVAQVTTGHTVTINADVTVLEVTNAGTTGKFLLGNGRTLTANVTGGAPGGTIEFNATTSATINGNITNTAPTTSMFTVLMTSSGTLNINGTVTAGSASNRHGVYNNTTASSVIVVGNVVGSTSSGVGVFLLPVGSSVTVTGNVAAAGGSGAAVSATNITVTGDVTANTSGSFSGYGVASSNGTIIVNGNVYGGLVDYASAAVYCNGATTATINGNIYGSSTGTATPATPSVGVLIGNSALSTVVINGDCYAGSLGPAVRGWGRVFTSGSFIGNDSNIVPIAVVGPVLTTDRDALSYELRTFEGYSTGTTLNPGTPVTLVDSEGPLLIPEGDVREGVVYGGATLTGTLAVPPVASVAVGVPVDNTVGTGAVLLADIAAVTGAQIAAATTSP